MKKCTVFLFLALSIKLIAQPGCITYESSEDVMRVPYSPALNFQGDFTISLKAKFADVSKWNMLIVAQGNGLGLEYSYDGAYLKFSPTNWTSDLTHIERWSPVNDTWYHIVLTRSGNTWTSYINGSILGISNSANTINYNETYVLIIGNYFARGYEFKGSMTDLTIWNIALNADYIVNTLPNPLTGNEQGLLLYYNMNETGAGAGITVRNKANTGDALNGITGGTLTTPYFSPVTRINETTNANQFIYPNPCNDVLFFKNITSTQQVEVFDIVGKMLMNTTLESNSLDVSALHKGQYFVKMKTNKGNIVEKFIKQ